jgi:prepilin-type processing-associated H-X9-DG protein
MYKVLGIDGKEYGPVSADMLRQWIAERRANGQTRVQAKGASEWKALADIAEFSAALGSAPRSVTPPPLSSTAAPAPSTAKTSGMAVASLVLGVLGFCGVTALAGLILGIVAQVKISRSGGRLKGKGLAIAGIVISGIMLFVSLAIMAGLLLPALAKVRHRADTYNCSNNAQKVALAVRLYAEENDGKCPPAVNWCDAIANNLPGPDTFKCPQRRGEQSGFGFNAKLAGRTLSSIPPDTVMIFESPGGWNFTGGPDDVIANPPHGRGYYFGFADGSVRQVSGNELPQLRWEP